MRDRAILETFYSTGMRRMELANLKLYDLDAERGTVMIRQGKGKKDRIIPIGERGAGVDRTSISPRRARNCSAAPTTARVFLNDLGEPFERDASHRRWCAAI